MFCHSSIVIITTQSILSPPELSSGLPCLLTAAVHQLIAAVRRMIIPYVRAADDAAADRAAGRLPEDAAGNPRNVLVQSLKPTDLIEALYLNLPDKGQGKAGLLEVIQEVLNLSVNTWDQGFLDKLYSSNTPVRLVTYLPWHTCSFCSSTIRPELSPILCFRFLTPT